MAQRFKEDGDKRREGPLEKFADRELFRCVAPGLNVELTKDDGD
jgi:hypothetical protein